VKIAVGDCRSHSGRVKRLYGRKEAAFVAAQLRTRLAEDVTAYRCATCHGWHVGHTPSAKRVAA
jgi:hypothetical protein